MSNLQDLFEDNVLDGIIDSEQILDIDMDKIDEDAAKDAADLVINLSKFYYDDKFMAANPTFKKRVDTDLESLRVLIKMRKSDEIAHDNLLKAIANNSSNASLYRSLTEIQKTIISITTKMGEIITGLNNLMKGFQLEINFPQQEDNDDTQPQSLKDTYRGSKEFIESMNQEQNNLFENNEDEEEDI